MQNLPNIKCPCLSTQQFQDYVAYIPPPHVQNEVHTRTFTATLPMRAEDKKRPKCPLIWDWVKQTME